MSDASSERASDDESEVELSIFRYGVLVLTGRFSLTVGLTGMVKSARCTDVANATDRSLEID